MGKRWNAFILSILVLVAVGHSEESEERDGITRDDLSELSLEELLNVEVTSVSKKSEKRSEAAAAVYVLTQEDIRRSGATTIPDALRLVPGVSVARLDANKWSVTSRGFSGRFANKLLVLIDGRSVYTPFFSGVYWEVQDVLLEDVDRIEVVRGPGGTLWGANAVNGVINVITKHASETQGGLITGGAGSEESGFGAVRYGGPLGDDTFFRLYSKYFERDDGALSNGDPGHDNWDMGRIGFRVDSNLTADDALRLEGDWYKNHASYTITLPFLTPPRSRNFDSNDTFSGGYGLAEWSHRLGDNSELRLLASYTRFLDENNVLYQTRDTFDLELQHSLQLNNHDLVWGLGYRYVQDDVNGSASISFDPEERRHRIFSGFIQDEIELFDRQLRLTLGSKFEYNDFTGFELQPNLRLAWHPGGRHMGWAAISRAVRTPSRAEEDSRIASTAFPGILASLRGNGEMDSEKLWAYELGYRYNASTRAAFDVAVFYNDYDDLRTIEARRPHIEILPLPVHVGLPMRSFNNMRGSTYGVELGVDWQPTPWWKMRMGYSYIEMDLSLHPRTIDIISGGTEDETPEQQAFLHSSFNLPRNVELDLSLRYVDTLPSLGIDDYMSVDVRLGWKPRPNLEFAIVGQNLLDSQHQEYASSLVNTIPTEVERSVYGKVTWRF